MGFMLSTRRRNAVLVACLALFALTVVCAQAPQPIITLNPSGPEAAAAQAAAGPGSSLARIPRHYRAFSGARVGEASAPEVFTLSFHQATQLTGITGTPDFKVIGGSCTVGNRYLANDVCTLEVAFTPQGPGHRTGKVAIAHTALAKPFVVIAGGQATGPAVSFIPALISTVPSTAAQANKSAGLGAYGLAVDGGDNLYVTDVKNNLIWFQDSGGALTKLVGGGSEAKPVITNPENVMLSHPSSVAVDSRGYLLIADTGNSVVLGMTPLWELVYTAAGQPIVTGTTVYDSQGCTPTTPCSPTTFPLDPPSSVAIDPEDNVYIRTFGINTMGRIAELSSWAADDKTFFYLNPNAFVGLNVDAEKPLAVDSTGNIFIPYYCSIVAQNREFGLVGDSGQGALLWPVAGTSNCGFSGDGGLATGAQIGENVGGFAWDAAGNLYFTDMDNQRVRRIDTVTGIIRTVAGNGTAMNNGDGGPATNAGLTNPVGLAVDSRGSVYVTSTYAGLTSTNAVVREVGAAGALTFAMQATNTASPVQPILVSNVGNSPLKLKHIALVSGNTGDFAVDPNSTNCDFTGDPMPSGASCQIGVIFTPTATGARTAVLNLVDNTVAVTHQIQLSGTGATPAQPVLSPTTVTFPTTALTTTSAAQTITLSNTGGMPLTITGFGGTSSAPTGTFSMGGSSTCSASKVLLSAASCTFVFTFTPPAAQQYTAQFSVQTTAGAVTANMTGTGAAAAQAVLSPTSLTFGPTKVGVKSAAQTITLSNPGGMTLTISPGTLSGPGASNYSTTTTCTGLTLAVSASCTYAVTFTPASAGILTASLNIVTSVGTVTAVLTGTTPAAAAISPATLDFGPITSGSSSQPQAARLSNTGGAPLAISSASISGTNAAMFTLLNLCGSSVAGGATCTLNVTFKPTSVAKETATLTVVTAAGTVTTALTGTGTAPPTKVSHRMRGTHQTF